jgi:hypothetical protein
MRNEEWDREWKTELKMIEWAKEWETELIKNKNENSRVRTNKGTQKIDWIEIEITKGVNVYIWVLNLSEEWKNKKIKNRK